MEFIDDVKTIGKETKYVSIPKKICTTLKIEEGTRLRIVIEILEVK